MCFVYTRLFVFNLMSRKNLELSKKKISDLAQAHSWTWMQLFVYSLALSYSAFLAMSFLTCKVAFSFFFHPFLQCYKSSRLPLAVKLQEN